MTRGVLLIAFDTSTQRYTDIARYCAQHVIEYTGLPVALITNSHISDPLFSHVILAEASQQQNRAAHCGGVQWNNFNRYSAYWLSPWDETILLDVDYICGSDQLLRLFEFNQPLLCHNTRMYIGTLDENIRTETWGKHYTMSWATVLYFTKNLIAESVFTVMRMVQENYNYYSKIYGFSPTTYRNDYALSIALNTVYGHVATSEHAIPWTLINSEFNTEIKSLNPGWELSYMRNNRLYRNTIKHQDIHILNKNGLQSLCGQS
jgi:hypothetical protein